MSTYVNQIQTQVRHIGDTSLALAVQCRRPDGTVVDLTGKTAKFMMLTSSGTSVVAETTSGVSVTDATNGKITYSFSSGGVATAGTYEAYFRIYDSSSKPETFPCDKGTLLVEIVSP